MRREIRESMHVLALNSRREFFASHRATREIVAEPALVLSAASQQTDFVVTPSGGEAGRGLPGMVERTIPGKKLSFPLFLSFLSPCFSSVTSADSSDAASAAERA